MVNETSNYIVLTPDYEIVRIKGKQRVAEYIQEYYSMNMAHLGETRGLNYWELSQQNVRDEGLYIGGTDGACKIYNIDTVFKAIDETFSEQEDREDMISYLNGLTLEIKVKCRGDLSDLLTGVDELYAPDILDAHSY